MSRSVWSIVWVLVAASVTSGCAEIPAPEEESTGQIESALTATGADGAVYRLPVGSLLRLELGGAQVAELSLPINSDDATYAFDVATGDYVATLHNETGWANGTTWYLTREAPGSAPTLVPATLVSANPTPLDVQDGQTTPYEIRFQVPTAGEVSFSVGEVVVSTVVDEVDSVPTRFTLSGAITVTSQNLGGTPAQQAELAAPSGTSGAVSVSVLRQGDFTFGVDEACAPVMVGATSAPNGPLFNQVSQVTGGVGRICFAQTGTFILQVQRDGTFIGPLADAATYYFSETVVGTLPATTWDGATLRLDLLAEDTPLTNATVINGISYNEVVANTVATSSDYTLRAGF